MTTTRPHLVIVGNGMATTRLVEELVARQANLRITIIGEEAGPAYNRILLSAVLEGSHPLSEISLKRVSWYAEHGIDLVSGLRVASIDREAREVVLDDRNHFSYDLLVLATGAIPTLPPIRGLVSLDGQLHAKVHAFRSLADCLRLSAAVTEASRAVVVGGGLLGLQVARAMALRGVKVELVEGAEHLLANNVGTQAGQVLARSLQQLGTEVYTGARAVRLTEAGLQLDNGFVLDTDVIVLTAGGRPRAALARAAELMVRRGIVVDHELRSVSDSAIFAIGDCAEFQGRITGFVPPAWEQAKVLAAVLCGEPARYEGSRVVARLRATDLDVAVLGDPEHAQGDVVEVANPLRRTYRKLVVRDGVVEAGVLIGDLSRVGILTQLYDRRTVLAANEPGQLLMGERPAGESSTSLPDAAEVCACAGVSAGAIRACGDLTTVVQTTRATTGCGGCKETVCALLAASVARGVTT